MPLSQYPVKAAQVVCAAQGEAGNPAHNTGLAERVPVVGTKHDTQSDAANIAGGIRDDRTGSFKVRVDHGLTGNDVEKHADPEQVAHLSQGGKDDATEADQPHQVEHAAVELLNTILEGLEAQASASDTRLTFSDLLSAAGLDPETSDAGFQI